VEYGGSATAPGGQPDIAGPASANITYLPLLSSGSDSDSQPGFQPVPGSCGATPVVTSLVVSGTLGGSTGCNVALSGVATGSSFTFTGPNGYVFSNVFRTAGTYYIVAEGIKDPGTYTLIINGDSSTAQTIQVTGTACN
jgi:hypothetical protein